MRTAIFSGLLYIADAIAKGYDYQKEYVWVGAVMLITFIIMDIADFFRAKLGGSK